jgi:hypothetical protein
MQDLRNLTSAISTNDTAREMFASESLPYAQVSLVSGIYCLH